MFVLKYVAVFYYVVTPNNVENVNDPGLDQNFFVSASYVRILILLNWIEFTIDSIYEIVVIFYIGKYSGSNVQS